MFRTSPAQSLRRSTQSFESCGASEDFEDPAEHQKHSGLTANSCDTEDWMTDLSAVLIPDDPFPYSMLSDSQRPPGSVIDPARERRRLLESVAVSRLVPQRYFAAFRVVALTWNAVCGFIIGWFIGRSDSFSSNPPPVFLTEWGFIAAFVFCISATATSLLHLAGCYEAPSLRLPTEKDRADTPRHTLSTGSMLVAQTARVSFHIAIVLEPLIVIGFWSMVYPYMDDDEAYPTFSSKCKFPSCWTVHLISCLLLFMDAAQSQMQLETKLLPVVILYPTLWTLSQVWWVFTVRCTLMLPSLPRRDGAGSCRAPR